MSYQHFLQSKHRLMPDHGVTIRQMPTALYDWQGAIVKWALRKGRSAIFADCGLGKTFMQCAWADQIPGRVLMLAPLCVAEQTVHEAAKLGIGVVYARNEAEARGQRIVITNYERVDGFDPADYAGVVLDESSILKAFDGKTRTKLIQTFSRTPYRLCCTATPSPNDISELANHCEFLGLMTRAEFLATWFIHVDSGWRMKKHATTPFYRWMASWAVALRRPSDIGYRDEGFELPPLRLSDVVVESEGQSSALFPELGLKGIGGRLRARRDSLDARVEAAASLTRKDGQWILWCGLNDESDALAEAIPDAVNVQGSDSYAEKVGAVEGFVRGDVRVLVSKLKVLGFGMNFQQCHQMAFVGLSDSYEGYYQGIRRCWRFGQRQPVDVTIVLSDSERAVLSNVRQKEAIADEMARELIAHMSEFERAEVAA